MRNTIVSFYTPEYSEIVKNLIGSLKKLGLPYDIEERGSLGGWLKNVNQKPSFIFEKFNQHKGVIWLDADAVVKRYPTYFNLIEEDIAVHYRRGELNTGIILFKDTYKVRELLEKWVMRTKAEPLITEQKHLETLVNKYYHENQVSAFFLPDTYCYIDGITRLGEPVIFQTQASRRR